MDLDAVASGFGDVVASAFPTFKIADNPLDSVLPPTFFVADFTSEPRQSFGGFARADFTLRVLVSKADPRSAGHAIRGLAGDGTGSLYAAIEAPHFTGQAQTLGGACSDLYCTRITGYRGFVHDGVTYLGIEWTFRVIGEKAA
jgi:hypothetical protein